MIRNFKALITAGMALTALGAIGAVSAHAAEENFHCSIEPCTLTLKPDGATTTAHHVFVVKGESNAGVKGSTASFTCNELSGESTQANKTFNEATFTNLKYNTCKVAGETVIADMNTCDYRFTSAGGAPGGAGSVVHLECTKAGDGIDLTINGTVCVKVTPLTATGLKFHEGDAHTEQMTAENNNIALPAGATHLQNIANANCKAVGLKTVEEAKYTTGHTLVTAEEDKVSGLMASCWY
jgi:hypothetical protein